MKKSILTLSLLTAVSFFSSANTKISKTQYVESWKDVAISQMLEHNIPASITLAQGILESGSGNSELAKKGNNHFGIKCHGWKGKKMYMDDDSKGECFRVYKNAEQSFLDHSVFLKQYDRYAFLFTYDVEDYKSWAKGLKKAGYATNSKYPQLLIGIIEDLDLSQYDKLASPEIHKQPAIIALNEVEENSINFGTNAHQVNVHENKVKYVVAKNGDTFYKISKEFGLTLGQLYRYNDFSRTKDVLVSGDIVYIQPKKRRSIFKKKELVAEKEMTVLELSQLSAVNKKALKRLNDFTDDNVVVSIGDKVTLR